LPDGSRVAAVIPPCSLNVVTLTIRKFNARHFGVDDPNQVISKIARYRSADLYDKNDATKLIARARPRPYYYAEQTVTKAMASLGMTRRPTPPADSSASSREAETAPSR
jgi:hypothetical protein